MTNECLGCWFSVHTFSILVFLTGGEVCILGIKSMEGSKFYVLNLKLSAVPGTPYKILLQPGSQACPGVPVGLAPSTSGKGLGWCGRDVFLGPCLWL